jgi:hypothetical protein
VEEVEGEDAFVIGGALQRSRANGVVLAGAPVFLHTCAREVVILGIALVVFGAVDQMHNVVDLVITKRLELLRLSTFA